MTLRNLRATRRWLVLPAVLMLGGGGADAAEAPFDPGLERLGEILGSLQFLTTLCNGKDGGWRAEMERLLDAEKPDAARRQRFVASFNRGYGTFASTYRTCTPAAAAAIALYRRQGDELTRDLAVKFGN